MNCTKKIQQYICDCHIDVEQIEKETGIEKDVLLGNVTRPLNATEFLEVCTYLKIRPEEIKGYESM